MNVFKDLEFQMKLLALVCRDRNFLKDLGHVLEPGDFRPVKGEGREVWAIATCALKFWKQYREPIGPLLGIEAKAYADRERLGQSQRNRLTDIVEEVQNTQKIVAVDAITEHVIAFKKSRMKRRAVDELIKLQEEGKLTDEKWYRICQQAVEAFGKTQYVKSNYLESIEDRISRRVSAQSFRRFPLLMIDPLDSEIRAIARGQVGLILAYYKMGKSLLLNHISQAHLFQELNVLHFTLEDPIDLVEDRYDASITGLIQNELVNLPNKLRRKFARQKRLMHSRLKIIDGTEGGFTVQRIEEIWEKERNTGFVADVVVVDYDDEIVPMEKQKERRMEFAEIYRDFRKFIARRRLFGWLAAQTGRNSEGKKVITGGMVAEDISKIRKVTFCIGVGQGEWGDESRHLYVAAHKNDKQKFGVTIMTDFSRGVFYDRPATLKKLLSEKIDRKKKKED